MQTPRPELTLAGDLDLALGKGAGPHQNRQSLAGEVVAAPPLDRLFGPAKNRDASPPLARARVWAFAMRPGLLGQICPQLIKFG